MPIQYQPAPEFQVPNLNLMGAYAQGAALRGQELQQEKLAQQMEASATKDALEAKTKLQELNDKIRAHAIARLQAVPEGDQEAYLRTIGEFKDIFPDEYEVMSKRKWDADTRRMVLLSPEQQYKQTTKDVMLPSGETQTMRYPEFGGGGATPISGLRSAAKPEYMEAGGEVYRKTAGGLVPAPILPQEGMPGERLNMPAAKAAVANIESGGDYQAVGPVTKSGDRAYGKYQVMGANIPKWTKEVLGKSLTPQEFLLDKDAQEAVFEDQFRRNTEKYGSPQDAASVWFSGKPLAKAGQRADILGTTVPSYVNKFNAVYGRQAPVSNVMAAPITGVAPQMPVVPVAPPAGMLTPQQPLPPVAQPAPIPPPQPVTVGTRKQIKGQSNIDKTLDKMLGTYEELLTSGDIISSQTATADPLGTLGRYLKGTTVGQETEKALGSKAQDKRNRISALRGQLLQDIKEATGQTSKELDSNFELKSALERLGDPTMSIESIRAIASDLSSRYGSGKIKLPEEAAAPVAAPVTAPTANRPPLSSFYKR